MNILCPCYRKLVIIVLRKLFSPSTTLLSPFSTMHGYSCLLTSGPVGLSLQFHLVFHLHSHVSVQIVHRFQLSNWLSTVPEVVETDGSRYTLAHTDWCFCPNNYQWVPLSWQGTTSTRQEQEANLIGTCCGIFLSQRFISTNIKFK